MRFKEFLKLTEAGQNPVLLATKQKIGQAVQNNATAPSVKDDSADNIVKKSIIDVAKKNPAAVNALTQQIKNPTLGSPQMMKKK